jgi:hypothetical protein
LKRKGDIGEMAQLPTEIDRAKRVLMNVILRRHPRKTRKMVPNLPRDLKESFQMVTHHVTGVGTGQMAGTGRGLMVLSDVKMERNVIAEFLKFRGIQDVPLDVRVTGAAQAAAQGGDSIGHYTGPTGTMTCALRRRDGATVIMGSSHVLAASNAGKIDVDPIWHPGLQDGGHAGSRIGILCKYTPISFGKQKANTHDAALCLPDRIENAAPGLRELGKVTGVSNAVLQTNVRKIGRRSGLTHGVILMTTLGIIVQYPNGLEALFEGLFGVVSEKGPFALSGDSGAMVIDESNRAVGMIVAVTPNGLALAAEIEPTLEHFGVELF